MPPWHADPAHGEFHNDIRLSDDEKKLIATWVDNGCPEGNPAERLPAPTIRGWLGHRRTRPDRLHARRTGRRAGRGRYRVLPFRGRPGLDRRQMDHGGRGQARQHGNGAPHFGIYATTRRPGRPPRVGSPRAEAPENGDAQAGRGRDGEGRRGRLAAALAVADVAAGAASAAAT